MELEETFLPTFLHRNQVLVCILCSPTISSPHRRSRALFLLLILFFLLLPVLLLLLLFRSSPAASPLGFPMEQDLCGAPSEAVRCLDLENLEGAPSEAALSEVA